VWEQQVLFPCYVYAAGSIFIASFSRDESILIIGLIKIALEIVWWPFGTILVWRIIEDRAYRAWNVTPLVILLRVFYFGG